MFILIYFSGHPFDPEVAVVLRAVRRVHRSGEWHCKSECSDASEGQVGSDQSGDLSLHPPPHGHNTASLPSHHSHPLQPILKATCRNVRKN